MQLIFFIFSTILPFVTWTLEIDPSWHSTVMRNNIERTQKNLQTKQSEDIERYSKAFLSSFWFFEAQRSGKLPLNNRIVWRGDSMVNDHGYFGENLSGGYYDSGLTYSKYVFPTAFTTTILAWGLLTWTEAYRKTNQLEVVRETIKWATDYFIKCHPQEELFYIQVGDEMSERRVYGRLEQMVYDRPAYAANSTHPASNILGETAAALAATSIVFRDIFNDTRYSDICLRHAKELYNFALNHKGTHYKWMPDIYNYERNWHLYYDDLVWATLWLSRATMNYNKYFSDAEHLYKTYKLASNYIKFNYYNKVPAIEVMFNQILSHPQSPHTQAVERYLDTMINNVMRTEKGLAFLSDTDTLPLAANAAFLCLIAITDSNMKHSDRYYAFAKEQIDYILGMKTGQSYVVGFNNKSPTQIPHKASSCPKWPLNCGYKEMMRNKPNEQVLYGALVNGPDINDHFVDIRFNEKGKAYTKVRIDYNAGFTGALAGLLQLDIEQNRSTLPSTTHRTPKYTLDFNSSDWLKIMT